MRSKFKNLFFVLSLTVLCWPLTSCSSFIKPPMEDLTYQNVSIQYPGNWLKETEDLEENGFMIKCQKAISGHLFMILQFDGITVGNSPEDIIEGYFQGFTEGHLNITRNDIENRKFGAYDAIASNYSLIVDGNKSWGTIWSFQLAGNSYMVVCQSSSEDSLANDFNWAKDNLKIAASTQTSTEG